MNYESSFGGDTITARSEDLYGSEVDGAARSGRRRNIIIAIVVLALLVAAGVYFFGGKPETAAGEGAKAGAGESESQAPAVTVIVPGSGSVERVINATGTLAARREMPIGIAGEGGQVIRVLVQPGDWVRTGQVLAVIENVSLDAGASWSTLAFPWLGDLEQLFLAADPLVPGRWYRGEAPLFGMRRSDDDGAER